MLCPDRPVTSQEGCGLSAQRVLDIGIPPADGGETGIHRVLVYSLAFGEAAAQARTLLREVLAAAGVDGEAAEDAELVVGELAANVELHAHEPFEMRIIVAGDRPIWCEVVDGDDHPEEVAGRLRRLRDPGSADDDDKGALLEAALWGEHGRGLLLACNLTNNQCCVYPTRLSGTGKPGKAVAFPLPVALLPS